MTARRPPIVCLCGSTRFSEAFREANLRETLAGKIVLSIGADMHSDDALFASMSDQERDWTKSKLDLLHLSKIDLADEILVLNVNSYIGESTKREIAYAEKLGKVVRYLEPKPVYCTGCRHVGKPGLILHDAGCPEPGEAELI
jgi:hypothetical protein